MAHARITLTRAYEAVEASIAAGRQPSDGEIAAVAKCEPAAVRSILADLADAGRITIKGFGDDRLLSLGRKRSAFTPAKPVAATVVRRDEDGERVKVSPEAVLSKPYTIHATQGRRRSGADDEAETDAAVARIKAIVARPRSAKPASAKVAAQPTAVRLPASVSEARQVNVKLPIAAYAELERRAVGGQLPSQVMREIVLSALSDRPVAPSAVKPIVTAAMTAAAVRDRMPICDFVAMLLARGFAAYEYDASLERCA